MYDYRKNLSDEWGQDRSKMRDQRNDVGMIHVARACGACACARACVCMWSKMREHRITYFRVCVCACVWSKTREHIRYRACVQRVCGTCVRGACVACAWRVRGACVARVWRVYGACVVCVRRVRGMRVVCSACVVCVWRVCGVFVTCAWRM